MRDIVYKVLYHLKVVDLFLWLERILSWRNILIVQTYHRIVDDNSEVAPISILERGISKQCFINQIDFFQEHFDLLNLDDFLDVISSKRKLKSDALLLTFDDGYYDNLLCAYPYMQEKGVEGVVFVPTAYIHSQQPFWWLKLTNSIKFGDASRWPSALNQLGPLLPLDHLDALKKEALGSFESRREVRRILGVFLMNSTDDIRDETNRILDMLVDGNYVLPIRLMTFCELRTATKYGITVATHSHSHRDLDTLSYREQVADLKASLQVLKQELGDCPNVVCYPSGRFNVNTFNAALECGIEYGFTTKAGAVRYREPSFDPLQIPRVGIEAANEMELKRWLFGLIIRKYLMSIWRS